MKFSLFAITLFLSFFANARSHTAAYFAYKPEHNEIQKAICELRLQTAETLILKHTALDPHNASLAYMRLYASFYKVLVHLEEKHIDAFTNAYKVFEVFNENLPSTTPQKGYNKGSALLMKAIVAGAFNRYFEAATGFRSAYQELKVNHKKYPQFIANLKDLGALEAMIGSLPAQYHWVVSALGLDGTIAGGIHKIEQYLAKCRFEPMVEQQQAAIYLALIEFNFGNKQTAWQYYHNYAKNLESNLMQVYVIAYIGGKSGHNKEALLALDNRPTSLDYEQLPYLHFLKAEYLLHQLNFEAATWYKKYLIYSVSKNSAKDAYNKLSLISLLQNDKDKYLLYKSMGEKLQSKLGSEQLLINQDLEKQIGLNTHLLKARFLYDGGYYDLSLKEVKQVDQSKLLSVYQKTEYFYRLARVHQEKSEMLEAIKMYQACLAAGANVNTYYKPNACLQLGLIYKQLGYFPMAKRYFDEVTTFSNYDYEDSIRQKAKAGLNQLGSVQNGK